MLFCFGKCQLMIMVGQLCLVSFALTSSKIGRHVVNFCMFGLIKYKKNEDSLSTLPCWFCFYEDILSTLPC